MTKSIAERNLQQESETTEQESKELPRFRAVWQGLGYTAATLTFIYGLFNGNHGFRLMTETNDSLAEQTISDAAFRATGARLHVSCNESIQQNAVKEEIMVPRLMPKIVELTKESCNNLMAVGSGEVDSDKLVATQAALRLVAHASVIEGDILGASTPGEVSCVAAQYHGRVAEALGFTRTAAFNLQMAEVAGYDASPTDAFIDYAIPKTCAVGGPLDADIPWGVLPPRGSIRSRQ